MAHLSRPCEARQIMNLAAAGLPAGRAQRLAARRANNQIRSDGALRRHCAASCRLRGIGSDPVYRRSLD